MVLRTVTELPRQTPELPPRPARTGFTGRVCPTRTHRGHGSPRRRSRSSRVCSRQTAQDKGVPRYSKAQQTSPWSSQTTSLSDAKYCRATVQVLESLRPPRAELPIAPGSTPSVTFPADTRNILNKVSL